MKLILTAEIANLGAPGAIVEVKDGYGRNYLLPRGYAILATKGATKQAEVIRRAQESRRIRDLDHAIEVKTTLENLGAVPIKAKVAAGSKKLFGSVTSVEVANAVRSAGGPLLDKRNINFPIHIKKLGTYPVHIRLHPEVTVAVPIEVSAA
jgi:large subunit ribosomal protein L9